jgi:hypothetical protein
MAHTKFYTKWRTLSFLQNSAQEVLYKLAHTTFYTKWRTRSFVQNGAREGEVKLLASQTGRLYP